MDCGYILQPADILAIKGDDSIGKVIRGVTHQNYSHIAIVGRDELHVFEAMWTGIRYREIHYRFGDFDVLRYPKITAKQVSIIIAFCSKKINQGYDYIELLSYLNHGLNKFNNPQKFICSELAYNAYLAAGIILVEKADVIATPGDIANSKVLKKINVEDDICKI